VTTGPDLASLASQILGQEHRRLLAFDANRPRPIVSILVIGTPLALKGTLLRQSLSKQEAEPIGEYIFRRITIMLTAICEQAVSESNQVAQNETLISDLEISRRVMQIRSRWTVAERLRRRRDAEQRFADLMTVLTEAA
jgi:hypothetical protein